MRFVGIDPATKTGFVALDENGQVIRGKELTGIGDEDPKRMITLINEVIAHVQPDDFVCIEGFPYSTQKAMFAGGLHHGIRNELFKRRIAYYEPAPNAVKKYVGVTGWTGEVGKKKRLTGPQKKRAVMNAAEDHFGFAHSSDNVVDAYILAQIAWNIYRYSSEGFTGFPDYQYEVIQNILYPKKQVK